MKKNIILFDQDTQIYRQKIYYHFREKFKSIDYNLVIIYDRELCSINSEDSLFVGIKYSFTSLYKTIQKYRSNIIISFVWLRYKFILPILLLNRIRGVKSIVWSHGINLQKKDQPLKNILYYLRQYLANALIIYTPNQSRYIRTNHSKLFIAYNTLNFYSFPEILLSKEDLKSKYNLAGNNVILTVARFDMNNRKVDHLIELSDLIEKSFHILIIGPGLTKEQILQIESRKNIKYLGPIYDEKIICEYYKMSDIFVMPGAIGLALNQAFYFGTPVILESVPQGPEAYYLSDGNNGLYYKKGDVLDLNKKIRKLMSSTKNYLRYSENAEKDILNKGSIEKMLDGFMDAIKYVSR